MNRSFFSLNNKYPALEELVITTDKHNLACWALACAERVLPFFDSEFPEDPRPRQALETLQDWIDTGEFSMETIRGVALASHAAAREVGEESPACSVARSAGQAVSTAHVKEHAMAAANYALQTIFRANPPEFAEDAVNKERLWQLDHIEKIIKSNNAD